MMMNLAYANRIKRGGRPGNREDLEGSWIEGLKGEDG